VIAALQTSNRTPNQLDAEKEVEEERKQQEARREEERRELENYWKEENGKIQRQHRSEKTSLL
jgi:hypothetical protein